ncbi:MAG: 16S rRNA (cytosine(967)-C(5))-methyltransferase RsmB [Lachnospiraceae bacterium]|nr:16S rRNA (cytosine(967)-C(5))-methyltransferase RsmB [Lachnospiraceae bacterium]
MAEQVNIRLLALEYLLEVTERGAMAHTALRGMLERHQYLEKRERAFPTRLCEGTLERLLELDWIIDQVSKVPVRKQKPVIRGILRLSVYQLKYMDQVPDAAVCSEAVRLARAKGFSGLTGFVNGVLRNIARRRPEAPPEALAIRYSTPGWIVEQWTREYGAERAARMLEDQYRKKPTTICVNLLKITREKLKERLEAEGAEAHEVEGTAPALAISGYDYLRALPSFHEGLFQVQDVSSMQAALMAAPCPGDYCIDLCAAPGGKSLHLAELLGGTGMVEARDLTEEKIELIRENIQRSQLKNIHALCKDATISDEESFEKADVVLADLPCSGLGVLNKKHDLKYRMTPAQQDELVQLQRRILDASWRYVKPGGTLLYSTCTVHWEENEGNVEWILGHYPFVLEEQKKMLPGIDPWDGFFIAKFRRKTE